MTKKILITGGAGFIGFHLAAELSKTRENRIVIADNLQRGRSDAYLGELIKKSNIEFLDVDLADMRTMSKIWNFYDDVYHLAAMVGVKHCMKSPEKVLETNILSTMNVVKLVRENGCKKILFSSTCETYAGGYEFGNVRVPTDETVPLTISDVKNPRLSYAVSKIAGEQLIMFNATNYDYSIVRYHNVYGPRMGYSHVIPEVIKRIYLRENPFKIYGFDQTRSFCHVFDAVAQTIGVMESRNASREIVHVGNSTQELRVDDLVQRIFKILQFDGEVEKINGPAGSVSRRCPDTTKMTHLTGITPKISIDEGLDSTVSWYLNEIKLGNVWE